MFTGTFPAGSRRWREGNNSAQVSPELPRYSAETLVSWPAVCSAIDDPPMKPSLFLPALLLAALPGTLHAAPGTVNEPFTKLTFTQNLGRAGSACAPLGDLDGDGNPDLAVGIEGNDMVAILFLGANQSLNNLQVIGAGQGGLPAGSASTGSRFGASLANLGDLDGDGLPELAVGAPGEGIVYILFLRADGTVRETIRPLVGPTFQDIGASCAAVGDLDGNGVTELIVGGPLDDTGTIGTDSGALFVLFLNSDGSLAISTKIANGLGGANNGLFAAGDRFGSSCALLGDINGDGFPEVAVGSRESDIGGPNKGLVFTFSLTAAGTAQNFREFSDTGGVPLGNGDRFGSSVASLGDIDGNGVPDLAVGAPNDGAGNFGAVHILRLAPDGSLAASSRIANGVGGLPFGTLGVSDENFGASLALVDHSPTTGLPLLAVGTPGDSTGGDDRGAVYLLELGDDPIMVTTLVDENDSNSQRSLREAIFDADNANEFRTIRFDPALSGGVIELGSTLVVQGQPYRITGEGLDGITISGVGQLRIFEVDGATLTVDSLNLVDGNTSGGGGAFLVDGNSRLVLDRVTIAGCEGGTGGGGAIRSEGGLAISNCTFRDNTANNGGAISNIDAAPMTVTNTTFARNSGTNPLGGGGAIAAIRCQFATLRHCTFVGNETTSDGGAILKDGSTLLTVTGSLFAGNLAATGNNEIFGVLDVGTENAFKVPLSELMPFGDYGGPTPVQPLKPTSTTKSTVSHHAFPATDQRGPGFPRTRGSGRDPGAVEGTELRDFQPDGRIGLSLGRQSGNNRYNSNGLGQTVSLTLAARKKKRNFFSVENDGLYLDAFRLRSTAPSARTLRASVFRITGGRANVSARVFRTGLAVGNLNPRAVVAYQAEWSRKNPRRKAKQTLRITAGSGIAPKSDVVVTRVR